MIDFYTLKDAFLVGIFMSFMIGPVFFMLLKTSVLKGFRAAVCFDMGVVLGDISFMLIAYFGSRTWLEKIKDDPRLFLFGGIILVVYGVISFFDKRNKKPLNEDEIEIPKENNYFKLFLNGFFLNFINVGVLAFWLGLVIVIGPTLNMNPKSIFWYFAMVILGYVVSDLGKIILAKQLKKKLTPLVIYRIKKGMAILLIVFGAVLMLKAVVPKNKINTFIKKITIVDKK